MLCRYCRMKTTLSLTLIALALIFVQCSGKGQEPEPIPEEKEEEPGSVAQKFGGSWTSFRPSLFHDGASVEGENFIVYSDKSSQAWRETILGLAEESFLDIKTNFGLEDSDFRFVSTQPNRKIHILTNYDQYNRAEAYRDGLIMRSKDGPNFFGDHETWHKVFQHEITHVVEFLIIGIFDHSWANAVWMREGFANYGARNHRIQTVAQLAEWREKMKAVEGGGNPIEIKLWGDFPASVISNNTTTEYYGFFELAVRYLLDEEKGNGTSFEDLKAYFDDLGAGVDRDTAFRNHFGMTMTTFKNNFWALMERYLED